MELNSTNRSTGDELKKFLDTKLKDLDITKDNFFSIIQNIVVENGSLRENTDGGIELARFKYQMFFFVERLKVGNLGLLLAIIQGWLISNYSADNLPKQSVDYLPNDTSDEYCDVTITIDFIDNVFVTKSNVGPIILGGENYEFGSREIGVAEEFDLFGNAE